MASRKSLSITDNLGLKIVSLALALLLEIYFYSPDNSVTLSVQAMIEIRNLPTGYMIVDPPEAARGIPAQLEIRGPKPLAEQFLGTQPKLLVDVSSQKGPIYANQISAKQLQLPSGVELLNVNPTRITVKTEKVVTKELPIVVERTGVPVAGYKVDELQLLPAAVVVRGPKSRMVGLTAIQAELIDVTDLTTSQRFDVALVPVDPLINFAVNTASVNVKISEIQAEQRFADVIVEVLKPQGFSSAVQPPRVAIVLSGPVRKLKQLNVKELKLIADASSLGAGQHEVKLTGGFLEGITVTEAKPGTVTVTLGPASE